MCSLFSWVTFENLTGECRKNKMIGGPRRPQSPPRNPLRKPMTRAKNFPVISNSFKDAFSSSMKHTSAVRSSVPWWVGRKQDFRRRGHHYRNLVQSTKHSRNQWMENRTSPLLQTRDEEEREEFGTIFALNPPGVGGTHQGIWGLKRVFSACMAWKMMNASSSRWCDGDEEKGARAVLRKAISTHSSSEMKSVIPSDAKMMTLKKDQWGE